MGTMRDTWRRFFGGGARDGRTAAARELARDEVVGLPRWRMGWSIRVEGGVVLVTREGDEADHVVEAGSELRVPGTGRVVAWALEASRIVIREATGPAAPVTAAALEPA